MQIQPKKKTLDVFAVGDMVDRAILFLTADNKTSMLSLQKGVFLFLYSFAIVEGYDYNELLTMSAFEPYKLGPFSESVDGQVDTLAGYGLIKVGGIGEKATLVSSSQNLKKYKYEKEELKLLEDVKTLLSTLEPMELTFYIYFNPLIDKSLRDYFTSKSEIKDSLIKNKAAYVKSLLRKKIIDVDTADLIMYGNN